MSEEALLFQNMRQMITLIDRLRDFNLQEYISLPRIAVLGQQSAGKSSLLEQICGLNFLPRGTGIVTRRPLELRMIRTQINKPYFIFPNDFKNKKFSDPKEIRQVISDLTDKTSTGLKCISEKPIICSVYSPDVPDLTLIDLPGITKNKVGDQPDNIEEITKGLVRKYCKNENTLILCVIPANIDISTSDALNFAKQLDPQGKRTLGVLTKVDLMDEGTDVMNILLNRDFKLTYGYVAVKGRSYKQTLKNMTVKQSIKNELDFFGKHPLYSTLPTELLGTRSLIDRTCQILYKMIQKNFPSIKQQIKERQLTANTSLKNLGEEFPEKEEDKLELVFRLIRKFKNSYDQQINGKYFHQNITKTSKKIKILKDTTITFQLNEQFTELFEKFIVKDFQVTKDYTDDYIQHAIIVYQGESIPGFHSFDSFLFLIHPKLEMLKTPIFNLLSEAKLILEEKGLQLLDHIFKQFKHLHSEVREIFLKILSKNYQKSYRILKNLLKCEDNYLFTNDSMMFQSSFVDNQSKIQSSQQILVQQLRTRIDKYFFIVVRNLKDIVPKVIGKYLVRNFNKTLEVEILNHLNEKNYCIESFQTNQKTQQLRNNLKKELTALNNAENLLLNNYNITLTSSVINNQEQREQQMLDLQLLEEIENQNREFLEFNEKLIQSTKKQTNNNNQSNFQNQQHYQQRHNQTQRQNPYEHKNYFKHHQNYTQKKSFENIQKEISNNQQSRQSIQSQKTNQSFKTQNSQQLNKNLNQNNQKFSTKNHQNNSFQQQNRNNKNQNNIFMNNKNNLQNPSPKLINQQQKPSPKLINNQQKNQFQNNSNMFNTQNTMKVLTDPRTKKVLTDPRLKQVITDPRTKQLVTDPRTKQLITDPRIKQIITDPRTKQILTDPRTQKFGKQVLKTGMKKGPELYKVLQDTQNKNKDK